MRDQPQQTVGGVVIEADASQARSRRETTWAGMAIFSILIVLGLVWYFYNNIVTPKQEAIRRVDSETAREQTNLSGMRTKSEGLHEMIELNEVMEEKWAEAEPMFFVDYWDVEANFLRTMEAHILEAGLYPGGAIAVDYNIRGDDIFPVQWNVGTLSERLGPGGYKVGGEGIELTGDLLINPLAFDGALAGNFDRIQTFLTNLNYESDHFVGVYDLTIIYFTEETSLLTIQPVGTWEFVVFSGATYWLNADGTPNSDPGQFIPSGGGRRGGGLSAAGGAGGGSGGGLSIGE